MIRAAILGAVLVLGCSSGGSSGADDGEREPAGTPTDPVEVCERAGDVCKMDDARLGVCVEAPGSACAEDICYRCQSQH